MKCMQLQVLSYASYKFNTACLTAHWTMMLLCPSSLHVSGVLREPSDRALSQAVQNVKNHYLVVGLVEDFPGFVEALEFLLPDYFRGAGQVYQRLGKEALSSHVIQMLVCHWRLKANSL